MIKTPRETLKSFGTAGSSSALGKVIDMIKKMLQDTLHQMAERKRDAKPMIRKNQPAPKAAVKNKPRNYRRQDRTGFLGLLSQSGIYKCRQRKAKMAPHGSIQNDTRCRSYCLQECSGVEEMLTIDGSRRYPLPPELFLP